MWLIVFQRLTIEFLFDFVYFPVWWYTTGAKKVFLYCVELVQRANSRLAPGLWLRYVMVPMFGQRDWQGRIVSFFMRVVNIIVREIMLMVWICFVLVLFTLWFVWPVFIVFMLIFSLF